MEGLRVTHQNHHPQDQEEEEIIETVETPEELLQPIQDREVSPEDVVEDFHERLFDFILDSDHGMDLGEEGKLSIPQLLTLTNVLQVMLAVRRRRSRKTWRKT